MEWPALSSNRMGLGTLTHTPTGGRASPSKGADMIYVAMTDRFLSGWGEAVNKVNKFIVQCEKYEQALTIERNAKQRSEMKYVNICLNKPRQKRNQLLSFRNYDELGEVWKKGGQPCTSPSTPE